MKIVFKSSSPAETMKIGQRVGELLNAGDVVLLEADLAGGKTTLTKGIGLGLGVTKTINSPTFTIVKEYRGRCPLYHLDLYRLEGLNNDFDLEEYFEYDGVCVVEWPHQVEEVLPKEYLKIEINKMSDNERSLTVSASSKRYDKIVEELRK